MQEQEIILFDGYEKNVEDPTGINIEHIAEENVCRHFICLFVAIGIVALLLTLGIIFKLL